MSAGARSGRIRSGASFRRTAIAFENLPDVIAFRVIVAERRPPATARSASIHQRWQAVPGRFKDFISTPKRNGYRSLHTTVMHSSSGCGSKSRSARPKWTARPNSVWPRTGRTRTAATRPPRRKVAYPWLKDLLDAVDHAASARGGPRAHAPRDVPGSGLRLHPQGRADPAARRRVPGRFRLCRPHRTRRHVRRGEGQRARRHAAHPARERRPGRNIAVEGAAPRPGVGGVRRLGQGALGGPPLRPPAGAQRTPQRWAASCSTRSSGG